jgi:hypothetical protein|tara:strand:- start:35 stop:316 length:282 start_codon:yes stop_codon:yes gene_type:complete
MEAEEMTDIIEPDPIVATVMQRMSDRSEIGMEKYGCTMMREDVTTVDWIDHAIEELLDAAVYLERLRLNLTSFRFNNVDNLFDSKGSSDNDTE